MPTTFAGFIFAFPLANLPLRVRVIPPRAGVIVIDQGLCWKIANHVNGDQPLLVIGYAPLLIRPVCCSTRQREARRIAEVKRV